jgi:hypothetical protein
MTRISEASNNSNLRAFKGIVKHSYKLLDKNRNGQALYEI